MRHPIPHSFYPLPIPNSLAMTFQCHERSPQQQSIPSPLVGTMLWLVALDGEDSFAYARAAATESAGREDRDKSRSESLTPLLL